MDGTSPEAFAPKPQKAFAAAFAVMALTLAGCASGLGMADKPAPASQVSRVEDGTLLVARPAAIDGAANRTLAYTIRLHSGELTTLTLAGEAIPSGTPVLVEYGAQVRIIPQAAIVGG